MMKAVFVLLFLFFLSASGFAVSAATSASTSDDQLTLDQMKTKIELLRLENENLKLKLQLKAQEPATNQAMTQPTSTPQPTPSFTATPKPKSEEADLMREESRKSAELAKVHKGDLNLLVIDAMNEEIWYKGARFQVASFIDLADQEKWKYSQQVVAMDGMSRARNLYQCKNISVWLYDGRKKGVMSIKAPEKPDDLDALTPEGLSFKSTNADVRDTDFMDFFHYDGTDRREGKSVLKYTHERFLAFGDEIEFYFTPEDKLTQIRFGVLGEK